MSEVIHINWCYPWHCGEGKRNRTPETPKYQSTTNDKDVTCPDCLSNKLVHDFGTYKPSFPRTKFADEKALPGQITHIYSEVDEAAKAMLQLGRVPMDIEHLTSEIFDIIHSAETALSIMAEGFNADLSAIKRQVIEKNRVRRYYDKQTNIPL